jgi:hypothetical protein
MYEWTVRTSVSGIASKFRISGDFRPDISDVRAVQNVVVELLVRVEGRGSRSAAPSSGSVCRSGVRVQPHALLVSVGSRRGRSREVFVPNRPVVESLGSVIAVAVFRNVEGRRFSEPVPYGIRAVRAVHSVSGIGDDGETRRRIRRYLALNGARGIRRRGSAAGLPVPCDEVPPRDVGMVGSGQNRKSAGDEPGNQGIHSFASGAIRFQSVHSRTVPSSYGIVKSVG